MCNIAYGLLRVRRADSQFRDRAYFVTQTNLNSQADRAVVS
jgi:hypothetical protein